MIPAALQTAFSILIGCALASHPYGSDHANNANTPYHVGQWVFASPNDSRQEEDNYYHGRGEQPQHPSAMSFGPANKSIVLDWYSVPPLQPSSNPAQDAGFSSQPYGHGSLIAGHSRAPSRKPSSLPPGPQTDEAHQHCGISVRDLPTNDDVDPRSWGLPDSDWQYGDEGLIGSERLLPRDRLMQEAEAELSQWLSLDNDEPSPLGMQQQQSASESDESDVGMAGGEEQWHWQHWSTHKRPTEDAIGPAERGLMEMPNQVLPSYSSLLQELREYQGNEHRPELITRLSLARRQSSSTTGLPPHHIPQQTLQIEPLTASVFSHNLQCQLYEPRAPTSVYIHASSVDEIRYVPWLQYLETRREPDLAAAIASIDGRIVTRGGFSGGKRMVSFITAFRDLLASINPTVDRLWPSRVATLTAHLYNAVNVLRGLLQIKHGQDDVRVYVHLDNNTLSTADRAAMRERFGRALVQMKQVVDEARANQARPRHGETTVDWATTVAEFHSLLIMTALDINTMNKPYCMRFAIVSKEML